ncbi:DNA topoisomerase I [candidate division LCP-89 bacterium B3_LCP]|uniref:DNA topoisomerase 1 n=1 Tax=candidate division LCP-89 bacterium B3_LCP TaxID=2012998 RepID=A0A532V306_UNCL8|nr:MAG: DNA topoisomerase I [candidate division LCP-89 bacterium B3_LCP]
MNLIVVESPSKARTIKKFLGSGFEVTASSGHIKDLPRKDLGVDILHDFKPSYGLISGKKGFVDTIRKLAQKADRVYIATDPDREGEAIAAHVAEIIAKSHPDPKRALFYEITRDSVRKAISESGEIDYHKVDAQIARRVLDRLVGYKVSPFLWKTIAKNLSAGRVQSVALRLICEREAEMEAFVPEEYWSIHAQFSAKGVDPFWAELVKYKGKKVALPDRETAQSIQDIIKSSEFAVAGINKSNKKSRPYAPYTTSTLQQDASRRLYFTAKRTMALAQMLYEGVELSGGETTGLITYMRTDSTRVAPEALKSARSFINGQLGSEFLPEKARIYSQKKRTQDAHEAVRPTDVSNTPDSLKDILEPAAWKLYDLIWRRFVASQMTDSISEVTTIEIEGNQLIFRARGSKRIFDGFQKVYPLENSNGETLPLFPATFKKGSTTDLSELKAKQHFTQPPPRFTEATLVKALDELGIGRPSTYATIIATLHGRTYTKREKRKLIPTDLGKTVNKILVELFPDVFEVSFTARLEKQLDQVEDGTNWVKIISEFYGPFARTLEEAEGKRSEIKKKVQEVTDQPCEKCGKPMVIKWGRRGRFIACSGFPECKNSKPLEPPQSSGKQCPESECGGELLIKEGKYGRFLGCSNFPKCRHLEPIGTGVKCLQPDCDGELVERSSKGRRFYSCNRYPKCKYRINYKPEPTACDNCGHPFLIQIGSSDDEQLGCPQCKVKIEKVTESESAL